MSHWHEAVEAWVARFNMRRPDVCALTVQQANQEARSLMRAVRETAFKRRRIVVPELGTLSVKQLPARTMPGGKKVGATRHLSFRAGPKSRGRA